MRIHPFRNVVNLRQPATPMAVGFTGQISRPFTAEILAILALDSRRRRKVFSFRFTSPYGSKGSWLNTMTGLAPAKSQVAGFLFALPILLGAFLLFQVQPLIAKSIMPWFGGSAAVWTTCLLFFQVALLGGYAWAHWLSRQRVTRQKTIHLALLGLSLLTLPILPSSHWKPGPADDPLPRILGLLAVTIGLPYFLLASTSPLFQSWLSRSDRNSRPYRLFAFSNTGSMLGLLSYPVLVEPFFTNRQQVWIWSACYCVFCAVFAVAALRPVQREPTEQATNSVGAPGLSDRLLWLALAACASALLLAITNHLTQNIAAMPLLWVLPLSLYLLSLILCFDSDRWYQPSFMAMLGAVSTTVLAYAISSTGDIHEPRLAISVICTTTFILFMICHGELARRRPEPAHLTSFYLMVSTGGAAGGLFIGLAAPYLFNALYDPMVVLSLTSLLLVFLLRLKPVLLRQKKLMVLALLIAGSILYMARYGMIAILCAGLLGVWVYRVSRGNQESALYTVAIGLAAGITCYLAQDIWVSIGGSRMLARNFYGALAVYDEPSSGSLGPVRVLRHGTIEHGEQLLWRQYQRRATTYYAPRSGVGLAMDALMGQAAINVGVIGLGAGTLVAYARPSDRYCFYEIDPNVIWAAQSEFVFLRDSPVPPEIIPGDARLSLERAPGRQFDILAVDAFSGDAIPVHLLTREAFDLYWRHLKPDGILAVHVTSRYLSLGSVVALNAAESHKPAMRVVYRGDREKHEFASEWVLVSSRPGFFDMPAIAAAARPITPAPGMRAWTDDYSNLYSVLR